MQPTRDHDRQPSFELDALDLRAHYGSVLTRNVQSVLRQWGTFASCVAVALTVALSITPWIPLRYSASALISPSLAVTEQVKGEGVSIDGSSLVTGEARLITSDAILRNVVAALGLAETDDTPHAQPFDLLHRFLTTFFPETRNASPVDRAVTSLRKELEVVKDSRSYLISISYNSRSAEDAARVVNAVALEYVREKQVQQQRRALAAAQVELARRRETLGEKHPKVLQAIEEVESAQAALDAARVEAPPSSAVNNIRLAIPNRTPAGPKGILIVGIAALLGLIIGVVLSLWRDRGQLLNHLVWRLPAAGEQGPLFPRQASENRIEPPPLPPDG